MIQHTVEYIVSRLGKVAIGIGVLAFFIAAAPVYLIGYVACQLGLVE